MTEMTKQNILYLGMAGDIFSPLLIYPDFDNLFVIDVYERGYCRCNTLTEQHDQIKKVLTQGSDENTHSRNINGKYWDNPDITHFIKSKCDIIEESEVSADTWTLIFKYDGKIRKLFIFYQNYHTEWPSPVKNIHGIIGIGSFFFQRKMFSDIIIKMLQTRMTNSYYFHVLYFNHQVDDFEDYLILNGSKRSGSVIGKLFIADKNDVEEYVLNISDEIFSKFPDGLYPMFEKYPNR